MTTVTEQDKERKERKKKNAPINARLRAAKGVTITIGQGVPETSEQMSNAIRGMAGRVVKEKDED